MAFTANYSVGGSLDEVKKIHLPPGLFPDEDKLYSYTKGFRMEIPAVASVYSQDYALPWDAHVVSAALVSSGYFDGDYWELTLTTNEATPETRKMIETCYTKEVPETVRTDEGFPVVPAGSNLHLEFNNLSGTSKTVWINLKFLHG